LLDVLANEMLSKPQLGTPKPKPVLHPAAPTPRPRARLPRSGSVS